MYFKYSLLIKLFYSHFYWYIGFLEKNHNGIERFFLVEALIRLEGPA